MRAFNAPSAGPDDYRDEPALPKTKKALDFSKASYPAPAPMTIGTNRHSQKQKKPDTFVSGFVPSAGIEPAQFPIGV
jgi:hypothetical protein